MLIISVRDNKNDILKRKVKAKNKQTNKKKTNKARKEQELTEVILKGWELSDFVVHLSCVFSN